MATKDLEPEAREHSEEPKTSSSKKRKSALKEIEVDVSLPEPPSKKAKRLLKKGKTLPAKPQSSDDEADADADDKRKAADKKKERSPYGVWVGNLRFNATKTELRKWFVDNSGGTIADELITRVHMPSTKPGAGAAGGKPETTKKPAENRGFAYVDFATFEANIAAIALSETELAGRKLLIKDSSNFEGRPKKEEAKEDADEPEVNKSASTKVFVGNLSFQVTEDDLWAHFEKCGKIRWIKVATFEDTGKCKGYGWVNFEEPEAAAWAVKGFVKVKETIDALEDFMDVDEKTADADDKEGSDDSDDDAKAKKASKKKKAAPEAEVRIKTRKWWVNQLLGRPLKIELAEDDQTRYNKRFRGQGAKKRMEGADGAAPSGEKGAGEAKEERKPRVKEPKAIKYANDVNIARLTGAAVASQGKKTTFE